MVSSLPAAECVDVFAALGDAHRQALLLALDAETPKSITELSSVLPLTRQGVTKHLRALESAGLARSQRRGRETRFLAEPAGLRDAVAYLDRLSARWDAALDRLRAHVENDG